MSQTDDPQEKIDWFGIFLNSLASIFAISGLVVIIYFLVGLNGKYTISGNEPILLDKTAQVGDFIGGVVGSLWAFAGVLLFFVALRLQSKEFSSQREELKLQREELANQRNEFAINRITNVIYRQVELVENKIKDLEYTYHNGSAHVTKKGGEAIRFFIETASPQFLQGMGISQPEKNALLKLENFIETYEVKTFSRYLENSIDLIKKLTSEASNGTSEKDNKKVGLDKREIQHLFQIAYINLNLSIFKNFLDSSILTWEAKSKFYGNNPNNQFKDETINFTLKSNRKKVKELELFKQSIEELEGVTSIASLEKK